MAFTAVISAAFQILTTKKPLPYFLYVSRKSWRNSLSYLSDVWLLGLKALPYIMPPISGMPALGYVPTR
ncbi:hypothetical protein [Fictibacillus enclensis]|uniref:hypothetical protein n=1 Tax=Fictibacillus enclensis TaxID=1017270 RepID=UPI0025A29106|nr:hypothetical protein [Fictibacillus enclensis]